MHSIRLDSEPIFVELAQIESSNAFSSFLIGILVPNFFKMYLDFFLFVANDVGNNPMGPFFLLRLLFQIEIEIFSIHL